MLDCLVCLAMSGQNVHNFRGENFLLGIIARAGIKLGVMEYKYFKLYWQTVFQLQALCGVAAFLTRLLSFVYTCLCGQHASRDTCT